MKIPIVIFKKHTTLKHHNETSYSVHQRASFTLEAAVIIPCFATFILFFLFLFRVLSVQETVSEALMKTAKEVAATVYTESRDDMKNAAVLLAESGVIFAKELSGEKEIKQYINGGVLGISLLNSSFDGDHVELNASYRMRLPVSLLGKITWSVKTAAVSRKWIGNITLEGEGDGTDAEYVYITPNGVAYHRKTDCPYLDLSIRAVAQNSVRSLRNKSGHKYHKCESCKTSSNGTVYITDYGEKYHTDLACKTLKRTVMAVKISEAGGRHACAKCAA
ncbi:MAG: hypothetical protein K6E56_02345 [Lachnospiraceae bacterium]|nr:hypothetical protein [Lachnospiraceae bacterium]